MVIACSLACTQERYSNKQENDELNPNPQEKNIDILRVIADRVVRKKDEQVKEIILCPTGPCNRLSPPKRKSFSLPLIFVLLSSFLSSDFVFDVFPCLRQSLRESSVPAQAILAHDRRRDALLSHAAAIGAVSAVTAASCSATAVTVAA